MSRFFSILLILLILGCSDTQNKKVEPVFQASEVTVGNKRCIGQVCLSAVWQKPEELAARELKSSPDLNLDSLEQKYTESLSFVITLAPYKIPKGYENLNILKVGVTDLKDYQNRIDYINSEMKQNISLEINKTTYKPKLFLFENNMDLTNYSRFIAVFSPDSIDSSFFTGSTLDLSFKDPFFGSGISHFLFDRI